MPVDVNARRSTLIRSPIYLQGPPWQPRDHAHLQDELQLLLKASSLAIHEAFRAVAALHDEALPTATLGQQELQTLTFLWLHQRGQLSSSRVVARHAARDLGLVASCGQNARQVGTPKMST